MKLTKRLLLTSLLASGFSAGAQAQSGAADGTVLPVWNSGSGRVEALLVLEPANNGNASLPWGLGRTALGSTFGLTRGDSLGLLCNNGSATPAMSNLASNCMLATLDGDGQQLGTGLALTRGNTRIGLSAGNVRHSVQSLNNPALRSPGGRIEQTDLTVHGQRKIGREGFVSLAGTYAKARLVSLNDASPALVNRWDAKSLSVGGGYGAFSANIVGRVVDVPGQPEKWEGLGLGLTWRTPWSGQLSVGADNVVTRGKNPFAPRNASDDEGTVPYVRYQQDL